MLGPLGIGVDMRKAQGRDPILIYQMGKVGSSSIAEALSRHGLSVVHLHALNPKTLSAVKARCRERSVAFPPHIRASQRVWEEFITPGRPLQIISLVRDPVARNISAYFENLQFSHLPNRREAAAPILSLSQKLLGRLSRSVPSDHSLEGRKVEKMIEEFLTKYPASIPIRWFDREVKNVLGVDVYKYPFPTAVGAQVICERRVKMLILRAETPDALKSIALQKFVDVPQLRLEHKNGTSQKPYSGWYHAFLQQFRPPDIYLQKVYGSQYMQHFYTPEEIQRFREDWTRGKERATNDGTEV